MRNKTSIKKLVLATAIATASTTAFAAQLEEIVVTAQKREQSLQDVPISLDVVGADMLSDRAVDSTSDLALAVPSINFQEGFGPTSTNFVIRGVGSVALEGGLQPGVAFVVDGVPLARVGEFVADLGDVERVEVLRGPQGTLFGRNATGGAIQIVRAKPTDEFEASIEQTLTSDDESITRVMVNGALSDTMRGRVAAMYKDRDGHIENVNPSVGDVGGEETSAISGKLEIDLSDDATLLLSADYRDMKSGMGMQTLREVEGPGFGPLGAIRTNAAGGQSVIDDPFKTNTDTPQENNVENYGFSADLTWELSDSLTLKSISAYRVFDVATVTDVDVTAASGTNPILPLVSLTRTNLGTSGQDEPIITDSDFFSQELRLEGTTDSAEWIAGVYYNNYEERPASETPFLINDPAFDGFWPAEFTPDLLAALGALGPNPTPQEFGAAYGAFLADVGAQGGLNSTAVFTNPRKAKAEWESYSIFGDVTFDLTDNVQLFAGLRWTMEDMDIELDRSEVFVRNEPEFVTLGDDFTYLDLDAFDPTAYEVLVPGVGVFNAAQLGAYGVPEMVSFKRSDRSEDWSGRIGLNWEVNDDLNVYVSAARGFVGAGANHGRAATEATAVVNPSVTESYEFGFKASLADGSVNLNGAIFHQTIDDLQTSQLIPGTVENITFNAGTLVSQGAELNLSWAATDLLRFDASVAYVDTEIQDLLQLCHPGQTEAQGCNLDLNGNPADHPDFDDSEGFVQQDVDGNQMVMAPELSYNVSARFDFPETDLPVDIYALLVYTYTDDLQFQFNYDPLAAQDDYGIVDLTIGLEDKEGRYSAAIFGKNLGDEYYDNGLSAAEGSQGRLLGRPSRGAQTYWGVKFKYNFY